MLAILYTSVYCAQSYHDGGHDGDHSRIFVNVGHEESAMQGLLVANMINGVPGSRWRKDFGRLAGQVSRQRCRLTVSKMSI